MRWFFVWRHLRTISKPQRTLKIFLVGFFKRNWKAEKKLITERAQLHGNAKVYEEKILLCFYDGHIYLLWFQLIFYHPTRSERCKYIGDSLSCFAGKKKKNFNVVFAFLNRLNVVATESWRKKNIKIYGISCLRYFYKWKNNFLLSVP